MRQLKVALIGNPNCGKSTLFNALTGAKQAVGNWPGVTVERKSGMFTYQDVQVEVVDLPGIYTLTSTGEDSSIDVRIACESLLSDGFDLIVNIIDISNLERNLYLTTQILELNKPVLIVANMQDVADRRGITVDFNELALQLRCPVIGLSATKKHKIKDLKQSIISEFKRENLDVVALFSSETLNNAILKISSKISSISSISSVISKFLAIRLLEGGEALEPQIMSTIQPIIAEENAAILVACGEDADILIADARYTYAHQVTQSAMQRKMSAQTVTKTQWIDKVVLNRFLGVPIFLAVMYAMFFFSVNVAGAFQDFFSIAGDAIFIHGLSQLLASWHVPPQVNAILTVGVGTGISTVIAFIPVICGLFLFLSFLEGSGYMARASFVVDKCMRAIGLPGKSFVPLIVGFGCNVPAIMATRTLDQRRDRLLTLMMTPFMSCGARMAIYTVFVSAFFPKSGQNIVFFLYVVGILMAILTGLLLRKTVLKGVSSQWVVELPTYHMPTPLALWQQTWHRLKQFIFRAGQFIVPVCMLLGALNALTLDGDIKTQESKHQDSVLAVIGKTITPVFSPMGITQENWPATMGLLSGVLAKEVVVGTLNTLYSQVGHLDMTADDDASFVEGLKRAVNSIPEGLAGLKDSFSNPITASAASEEMATGAMGLMSTYFDGTAGALAYLLFVLLYFPCVSAVAAMMRESSKQWAIFSMIWTTGLAYGVAVLFYQLATFSRHPMTSASWIAGTLFALGLAVWIINEYAKRSGLADFYLKNQKENQNVII
ncbi:MAG: feoB [Gammaproteobacteria bacterium]|nr:feoB [Gammaproteobacteria bacterium]